MNDPQAVPFDESLLTAYLDNELSQEERVATEKALEASPSLRDLLSDLARVRNLVASCREEWSEELREEREDCRIVKAGPWGTPPKDVAFAPRAELSYASPVERVSSVELQKVGQEKEPGRWFGVLWTLAASILVIATLSWLARPPGTDSGTEIAIGIQADEKRSNEGELAYSPAEPSPEAASSAAASPAIASAAKGFPAERERLELDFSPQASDSFSAQSLPAPAAAGRGMAPSVSRGSAFPLIPAASRFMAYLTDRQEAQETNERKFDLYPLVAPMGENTIRLEISAEKWKEVIDILEQKGIPIASSDRGSREFDVKPTSEAPGWNIKERLAEELSTFGSSKLHQKETGNRTLIFHVEE